MNKGAERMLQRDSTKDGFWDVAHSAALELQHPPTAHEGWQALRAFHDALKKDIDAAEKDPTTPSFARAARICRFLGADYEEQPDPTAVIQQMRRAETVIARVLEGPSVGKDSGEYQKALKEGLTICLACERAGRRHQSIAAIQGVISALETRAGKRKEDESA